MGLSIKVERRNFFLRPPRNTLEVHITDEGPTVLTMVTVFGRRFLKGVTP